MILGDVEEVITTMELDEETFEQIYKQTKRHIPMLFVRCNHNYLHQAMLFSLKSFKALKYVLLSIIMLPHFILLCNSRSLHRDWKIKSVICFVGIMGL